MSKNRSSSKKRQRRLDVEAARVVALGGEASPPPVSGARPLEGSRVSLSQAGHSPPDFWGDRGARSHDPLKDAHAGGEVRQRCNGHPNQ